jgi:uncharacterized protein (DUF2384 family)
VTENSNQRARFTMQLLSDWEIPLKNQIEILALPEKTPTRHLSKFAQDTPLPDDKDVQTRVEHLVGIADALRTTFPHNAHMGKHWMRTPHRRLNKKSPIAVLIEGGLVGLINVRATLDCSFDWYYNGS